MVGGFIICANMLSYPGPKSSQRKDVRDVLVHFRGLAGLVVPGSDFPVYLRRAHPRAADCRAGCCVAPSIQSPEYLKNRLSTVSFFY
jgi:hypothetical protein